MDEERREMIPETLRRMIYGESRDAVEKAREASLK
jgi:hypothetical protein